MGLEPRPPGSHMGRAKRWTGGEREPCPPLPVVVRHSAVATWMITKPLMSEKWELTRSTCSCLGPLLEGVMLNWTKALSWGSRLRTLGKGERRKVDHQLSFIPEPGLPAHGSPEPLGSRSYLVADIQALSICFQFNIPFHHFSLFPTSQAILPVS